MTSIEFSRMIEDDYYVKPAPVAPISSAFRHRRTDVHTGLSGHFHQASSPRVRCGHKPTVRTISDTLDGKQCIRSGLSSQSRWTLPVAMDTIRVWARMHGQRSEELTSDVDGSSLDEATQLRRRRAVGHPTLFCGSSTDGGTDGQTVAGL